jgi:hypothetical protein
MLAFVTATRFPGVIVTMAVFVEYLSSIQFQWRKLAPRVLWFLLSPIGLLLYMWHLNRLYGDPLFFKTAYNYGWSYQSFQPNILSTLWHEVTGLWAMLRHHSSGSGWAEAFLNEALFFGSWVAGVVVLTKGIRKLPVSYTFYGLASLLLFCLNSNFISVSRYLLPLFPLYLITVGFMRKYDNAYSLLLASSGVALGLFLTMFSNGFWTG